MTDKVELEKFMLKSFEISFFYIDQLNTHVGFELFAFKRVNENCLSGFWVNFLCHSKPSLKTNNWKPQLCSLLNFTKCCKKFPIIYIIRLYTKYSDDFCLWKIKFVQLFIEFLWTCSLNTELNECQGTQLRIR